MQNLNLLKIMPYTVVTIGICIIFCHNTQRGIAPPDYSYTLSHCYYSPKPCMTVLNENNHCHPCMQNMDDIIKSCQIRIQHK